MNEWMDEQMKIYKWRLTVSTQNNVLNMARIHPSMAECKCNIPHQIFSSVNNPSVIQGVFRQVQHGGTLVWKDFYFLWGIAVLLGVEWRKCTEVL